ncbi:MAG: phosphoribosylformylglycinamidine synthase subunit PurQ [Actinobacteria bacterium]|nr:MAG: phosphoribosylformylglycinamidine synthase subunit PurQ [Actinomycetota bacterium]
MNVGVIQFPGSNDELDAVWAVRHLGGEAQLVWHGASSLGDVDAVVLPGGFSYGDYLRCGAIARFAKVMPAVVDFARSGGPVLGICNGFQILCEAGLLPGALVRNEGLKFVCRPQPIRVERSISSLVDAGEGEVLVIPVKHGDGRYVAGAELLRLLGAEGQVVFRYCDAQGRSTDDANPNGATGGIAGVCNEAGNVLGMMPHPEHAVDASVGFHSADGAAVIGGLLKRAVRA